MMANDAFALKRELDKYRDQNGETYVYYTCAGCDDVVEMQVQPFLEDEGGRLEHLPDMHRTSCQCMDKRDA